MTPKEYQNAARHTLDEYIRELDARRINLEEETRILARLIDDLVTLRQTLYSDAALVPGSYVQSGPTMTLKERLSALNKETL